MSAPAAGSTFTLYLPLHAAPATFFARTETRAKADAPAVVTTASPREVPLAQLDALAGRTVLVVDDDIRAIYALAGLLEQYGMRVRFAESGGAALETLRAHPDIDAVLLDVVMPGMDGAATLRALRAERRFASLPVIAVTARASESERAACLAASATDVLAKPVDTDRLLTLLARPREG